MTGSTGRATSVGWQMALGGRMALGWRLLRRGAEAARLSPLDYGRRAGR